MTRTLANVFVVLVLILTPRFAFAEIEGGEGNESLSDGRMPKGAGAIINHLDRIAWWEGDGGPFHAEGLSDTLAMNEIVTAFGKFDVKTRRIVVHDGIGQSYWLNMQQSEMKEAAKIDWTFLVWPEGKWENSRWMFSRRKEPPREKPDLPAQIDVYTANIRWADVIVPAGIQVIDERLEAHGFKAADGIVIGGHVKELVDGQPMVATVHAQRIETKKGQGYVYTDLAQSKSDSAGKWVLKNLPPAWIRIVVEADGFVPRVVGYAHCFDQPQWHSFDAGLIRAISLSGRVTDQSGTPLADVDVRLDDVIVAKGDETGDRYESPSNFRFKTDADGRFHSNQVLAGKATVWLHKSGYSMGGLGRSVTLPTKELELQLMKAGSIRVTVDFNGQKRPKEYMVELEPEGGNAVRKYGGSATIDAKNVFTFENVPPGKYVVKGHPNPSTEQEVTEALEIDLQGSNAVNVTIKAK